jgi:cell division protein FtsL
MTPPAAATAPAVRRARSAAPARPLSPAPRPRRVSGPARKPSRATPQRRPAQAEGGLALGAIAALRSIDRLPLLDRLIRGRTLIVVVAFALIGIVTLQLGLLKLNAGIGRTLEQESSLQNENAALSIENSELAAGDRVEASAARLGMELVPVGSLRSLTPRPRLDAGRAASALSTPVHATSVTEVGVESASASTSSSTVASTSPTGETAASSASASQSSETSASTARESSGHESASVTSESSPSSAPVVSSQPSAANAGASTEATPAGGTQAGPAG